MSDLDHFDLLPITWDATSKKVTLARTASSSTRALQAELDQLNALHGALLQLAKPSSPSSSSSPIRTSSNISGVPPAPIPVNPKRTAQVTKLRDNGNAEYRRQRYDDAIRLYTLGLQMALQRPLWEPSALAREESASVLANRAQAHMALRAWPEGAADAAASVEARRLGNAKAWWRRGRCLVEMARLEEAMEWVGQGLEVEGEEVELVELRREIEERIRARR